MTSKRKTKAQKEVETKAALKQRLTDIYSGALGCEWADDAGFIVDAELLCRVVKACEEIFGSYDNAWLFWISSLGEYDSVDKLTEFYYRNGVRA